MCAHNEPDAAGWFWLDPGGVAGQFGLHLLGLGRAEGCFLPTQSPTVTFGKQRGACQKSERRSRLCSWDTVSREGLSRA
jgi:hypothetical protein